MSQARLAPKKKIAPPVRVAYTLTAADGNFIITQDAKNIVGKY